MLTDLLPLICGGGGGWGVGGGGGGKGCMSFFIYISFVKVLLFSDIV